MKPRPHSAMLAASLTCLLFLSSVPSSAQQSPEAQSLVQRAVNVELDADRNDHSNWRYRMSEKQENNSVYDVIETPQGSVKVTLERSGKPLSAAERKLEDERIRSFINDPRAQSRKKKDGQHDDESAEKLLLLLPRAFLWKVAEESRDSVTLHFAPDPQFKAPDIESRVLGAMEGDLVVDKAQHRIATIRGKLSHDVTIGFGLLGNLRQGGTFNVERRQLAPGVWQITETHVHIDGRALLFKTIGQQTDEVKSNFSPVPPSTTLAEAAAALGVR